MGLIDAVTADETLDDATAADAPARDGDRTHGRRGRATRRRLLDAAAGLLESQGYRGLTVADIARDAGTSPATFYLYFSSAEEAVLALASDMADEAAPRLAEVIEGREWHGEAGWAASLDVADAFISLWERDRSILRVIDLVTDEGDLRFRAVRTRLLAGPAEAFVAILRARSDREVGDPFADAGVLVSMLAHVAAHIDGLEAWGASHEQLRRSMARVVFLTLTGGPPPID